MQIFITEHGSHLCIENGRYCVRRKEDIHYFPTHEVASIYMHKGVSVTHETLAYIIENEVDFLVIGKFGQPIGRLWGEKPGSISTIRKNQLAFSRDDAYKMPWIQNLIQDKIEQQILLLDLLACIHPEQSFSIDAALKTLKKSKSKIIWDNNDEESNSSILSDKWRGIEGAAAKSYFQTISSILPEDYRFKSRTRPATDRFNSMLNYCYGILYARIEGAMLRAGLDPYIGIWHRDEYNRPSLVFDVIERFRAWADYTVIHLCMQQVMINDFFAIQADGMLLMEEEAKRILVRAFTDYLEEIVELDLIERSRMTHIELHCQKLATYFKNLQI